MNNLNNLHVILAGGDALTSHLNAMIAQFMAASPKSIARSMHIHSSNPIVSEITYKCLKRDVQNTSSIHEGRKYSSIYPLLDLSYSFAPITCFEEESFLRSVGVTNDKLGIDNNNIVIITTSNTSVPFLQGVIQLLHSKTKHNYILCHCDVGNLEDGGVIQTVFKDADSSSPTTNGPVPVKTPCDEDDSFNMRGHVILGSAALFNIFCNIVSFDIKPTEHTYFNYSNLQIDIIECKEKLPEPIKILGSKPHKTRWIKNKKKRNIRAKKAKNKIDDKFHVLILGTGATGGIATSELLHLFNHHSNKIAQVVLMDGDHSESKNLRNQRFTHGDLGNFKVHSLCQRYSKAYKNIKISALPEYLYTLDNKELERIFKIDSVNDKNILIYSFVDNDATRKVCDSYYYGKESNVIKNLINFDSGNGMNDRSGQVFIGYKQYGKIIQDFIGGAEENEGEIRNNAEDISSIGTCTRVIEESPQHSSTNYMAAVETITSSIHLIKDGIIPCHYSFFDLQEGFMNTR